MSKQLYRLEADQDAQHKGSLFRVEIMFKGVNLVISAI